MVICIKTCTKTNEREYHPNPDSSPEEGLVFVHFFDPPEGAESKNDQKSSPAIIQILVVICIKITLKTNQPEDRLNTDASPEEGDTHTTGK